jgi:hypothetical protein
VGRHAVVLGMDRSLIALGFSVVFSLVVYFMFSCSRLATHRPGAPYVPHRRTGHHRALLGIQTSIPLSLGQLGALSFVRFRTPVRTPPRSVPAAAHRVVHGSVFGQLHGDRPALVPCSSCWASSGLWRDRVGAAPGAA